MDEVWVRALLAALAVGVVVGGAMLTRSLQRPGHPTLVLTAAGFSPGIVMFTSTDCTTCKDALSAVRPLDVPLREVTWELEAQVLERLEVSAVPLTVFVGPGDAVIDQIVGVPSARRLARAEAAWRLAAQR
jgi:hypothetical protein